MSMLLRHLSILYATFELQFFKSYTVSDIKIVLNVFKPSFDLGIFGVPFLFLSLLKCHWNDSALPL